MLEADTARRLAGLVFDLDGTVLTHGALTVPALAALYSVRAAGLRLIACTGRPASWGAVLARQWPIDIAVTENGALSFVRKEGGLTVLDRKSRDARARDRGELERIAAALASEFPDVPPTDDAPERRTDFAFDVGEHARVSAERRSALHTRARALGARTFESAIHLHVTLDAADKASGTLFALAQRFGEDATSALGRYAFVGDSLNDAACFSAFRTTIGVANVRSFVSALSCPPRYVTDGSEGQGFAELAAHLTRMRTDAA